MGDNKTVVLLQQHQHHQQQQHQQSSLQLQPSLAQPVVSNSELHQVVSMSSDQVVSGDHVVSHAGAHILVSNPADIAIQSQQSQHQALQLNMSSIPEGLKTMQINHIYQTVQGPNGEQQLVHIPQHELQQLQSTQQLAQITQSVQHLQQQQQQHYQQPQPQPSVPLTLFKSTNFQQQLSLLSTDTLPKFSSDQSDVQVTLKIDKDEQLQQELQQQQQHEQQQQQQQQKQQVNKGSQQIHSRPAVKQLLPGVSEILKESKERFLKMSVGDRSEFLNWMVWRLSGPEIELMDAKIEKKKRISSRKGAKRQTGATGEKINVCRHCPKSFAKKTHLTVHERIHTGEKPFVCSVCDKAFAQSTGLKTHKLKHIQGETPFSCPLCNKQVTTKGNLKLHMKLHSGEKPFYCDKCDRSFPRKSALNRHMSIHNEEKPFQCRFCVKTFRRKTDLETHERIHTGVKPYQCHYCSKAFSDQRNWKAHEKKHSGAMNCRTCGSGPFQRNRELQAHIQTHASAAPQTQAPQMTAQQQHDLLASAVSETTTVNVIGSVTAVDGKAIEQVNGSQLQHATIIGINCPYCTDLFKDSQHLDAHVATQHMEAAVVTSAAASTSQLQLQVSQRLAFDPQQQQQYSTTPLVPVQSYN